MQVRRVGVWLGALAIPLGAASVICAQSGAPPTPAAVPQFKSGVALLRLDASVVDDGGRAIGDLTSEDFHVTIDGKPRNVVFAHFTGTTETAGSRTAAPATVLPSYAINTHTGGGRAVVLVIDLESIRAGQERVLLDTAAQLVDRLRPIDAAAVVPLPGQAVDLTRDHQRISQAIRQLRGTSHMTTFQHNFSLDEALAFERRDRRVMDEVIERECSHGIEGRRAEMGLRPICPPELERDTTERLMVERLHIQNVLTNVSRLAKQLKEVHAPSSIVLISGGLGFEQESLGRFQQLQQDLKDAGVSIASVQVDQPEFDASTSKSSEAANYATRDRQSGLANVATMSGGVFYAAVGRAKGVFDRLRTELTEAYELAVEAQPGDLDGRPHEVHVATTRKATVHARPYVRAAVPSTEWPARLADLIAQPVDVDDLPIAIAAHSVRGDEATTLKVMIRADIGHGVATTPPVRYATVIIGANDAVTASLTGVTSSDGGALISTQLPPGKYRVRFAAIEGGGRTGKLELPIVAGLRAVAGFQLGDLIVGTVSGQSLTPSIYASAAGPLIPTLEMTTADSARFGRTSVGFEIRRSGSDDVVATMPASLEETAYERQRIARASVPTIALAAGEYTMSAIVKVDGQPAARVSRTFVLEPATAPVAEPSAPPLVAAVTKIDAAPPAAAAIADPMVADVMRKAAAYVGSYGEQMSAVVGVETYTQNMNAFGTGVPARPRKLVAEFALVKTGGAVPWIGYRDVIDVNGEPVHDRRDRIVKILADSSNPLEEAARLTAESARYNIGPVTRNFNLPTTALFFFHEANLSRFTFTRKGTKKIDGIETVEIAFRETARPTLITTRDGKDVASEGTLWVVPGDGTIVRTRLQLKGFADTVSMGSNPAPRVMGSSIAPLESTADVEVTYRRDEKIGMWLPARMAEEYQGAIPRINNAPFLGVSHSNATYSDYKRFGTSSTVIGVKK